MSSTRPASGWPDPRRLSSTTSTGKPYLGSTLREARNPTSCRKRRVFSRFLRPFSAPYRSSSIASRSIVSIWSSSPRTSAPARAYQPWVGSSSFSSRSAGTQSQPSTPIESAIGAGNSLFNADCSSSRPSRNHAAKSYDGFESVDSGAKKSPTVFTRCPRSASCRRYCAKATEWLWRRAMCTLSNTTEGVGTTPSIIWSGCS